jgi:hypothetical protein
MLAVFMAAGAMAAEAAVPKVREERPRVFLRAKTWDGPSVEKIKSWMGRPEYECRIERLKDRGIGLALYWLVTGDEAAGKEAIERNKRVDLSIGGSPSYSAPEAQIAAALYDWLRHHPGFDEESRKKRVTEMEASGDHYMAYLADKNTATPFYCRISAALGGLTAIGLALHGDSPKADGYVQFAARFLREKMGTIRQVEDGATADGMYGYFHQAMDLACTAAAFRSATDWDAAQWIQANQGDWLQRQLLWQIRATYPNGQFIMEGDISGDTDHTQYRRQIDAITGMYRNGFGRTWADGMQKRWGMSGPKGSRLDYHREYVWQFFVFNDPEVQAKSLDGLPLFDVFSPKLHGFACWRDSWKDDATIIHFKCGDTVSHHGTYDQGKFTIYRKGHLAIKDGGYLGGYKSSQHLYYKSAWSANVVIFDHPQTHGWQPLVDMDGPQTWTEWKAKRDASYKHPATGVILANESNEKYARVLGDLSGSTHPTGSSWQRELVFLSGKYLLVLDRVKPGPEVKTRWLLHSVNAPRIEAEKGLAVMDNGESRLFCRTLLPEKARLLNGGEAGRKWIHKTRSGEVKSWEAKPGDSVGRLDVVPPDEGAECVYLNVLYPTDTGTAAMPECAVEKKGEDLVVKVGETAHTFAGPKPK